MKITEIYESNTSHSQPQKPPVNESLVSLSEHIKRQVPLCDSIFRYQSEAYFDTFNKARQLREAGSLPQLDWESEEMLGTDIGKSIELEGVGTVWLDVPYLDEHVKGGLDSYYQLTKAKSLAKADGHDYDKLPEYHRGADQPHKEKYMALAKEVNEVSDFKKRELEYELRHEEPKRDPKKRVPYRTPQERIQDAKKRYSKAVGVMKGKTDEVKEAKGLGKRVKVVKGHFAGEEGTIREIKHGAFKGAPKSYYIDLDNGEMADNLPADVLRLIKRTDEKEKMLTLKDIDNGGKKDVKLTFKRKPDGTPIDKKQPQKEVKEVSDFKKRELEYELRHEEPKRDPNKRIPYRTPQEKVQDAKNRYSKAVGVMKGKTDRKW
jgi:hypothetical protein